MDLILFAEIEKEDGKRELLLCVRMIGKCNVLSCLLHIDLNVYE